MLSYVIQIAKLISFAAQKSEKGSGSTWPGHIALKLDPKIIQHILNKNPHLKIILVAGTNGKTTTTKLLQHIFEKNGLRVFRNDSGANLLNGIASTLIRNSSITGSLPYDVALFEVDENTLPLVLERMKPDGLILLNLFRDQLDRYGEVNTIAKKWFESVESLSRLNLKSRLKQGSTLIVNGDDPQLTYLGENSGLNTHYFGVNEKLMRQKDIPHDVDFLYCPNCQTKLNFRKISYSHMGRFLCKKCSFSSVKTEVFDDIPNPMLGLYNKYNINAAALAARKVFEIDERTIQKAVSEFTPAFGRQEQFEYNGKNICILLAKNPAGFNQTIEAVIDSNKRFTTLLVLNDRIPDGRDVSWIWDVDFENLSETRKIFISGDRAYDMGLRIKYSQIPNTRPQTPERSDGGQANYQILADLPDALEAAIRETKPNETLFILPTYSAMLEVRKISTGRKIL